MATAKDNFVSTMLSAQMTPRTPAVPIDPCHDANRRAFPGSTLSMSFVELQRFLQYLVERVQEVGSRVALQQLEGHLDVLRSQRERLTPEEDTCCRIRFRQTLGGLIYQSPFIRYCLEKPRGYAGDFLTQEAIWKHAQDPELCEEATLPFLGHLISELTFRMDNPQANVRRVRYLRERLKEGGFCRTASIGSGSAIEYWDDLDHYRGKEIYLLDQDSGALCRAREMLTSRGFQKVRFIHSDVIKFILKNGKCRTVPEMDFVYSAGLFDYFSIASARKLAHQLWKLVAPGGTLLITNAHPDTRTRLWSEYACEWNLIYKTEPEMLTLAAGLQNVAGIHMRIDEFRVYQYLEIRKDG